ncbi:MAG: L-serine ammonia-lyase, iron-sulfur-dependent, subunit alpha [Saprospiraceae bacterium]|nr:L-serine ammonia-lyase, iron-sulfur-dependent, subunit alpha [Saprospiraceae bacterium]
MLPSIFNDVLGPVMRGPSSSHCAAALRIGRMCRDLMHDTIEKLDIVYDTQGSLATTHESQGSDMGLYGGLLGWTADDERLPDYRTAIASAQIDIHIKKVEAEHKHPNTYELTLVGGNRTHDVTGISIGGGMVEIVEIDGAPVSIGGGFYEVLLFGHEMVHLEETIRRTFPNLADLSLREGDRLFWHIQTNHVPTEEQLLFLQSIDVIKEISVINPVLPVHSRYDLEVPFTTAAEMMSYNEVRNLSLSELALKYESARGGISEEAVLKLMSDLIDVMENAVQKGLDGTEYKDRILPNQSNGFAARMAEGKLIEGDVMNTIILYVTSIMEVKSSMGVIVAAPTAGACAALPGAVLGSAASLKSSREQLINAMLSAGIVGVFIAKQASFAAEVGGCQAECGSGSCMAAAALVQLLGGSVNQSLSAASQALQNSLGMICDPIANRVEAPCLGKNVMAASNALSCANMALADYNHLIPLDQVIQTMAAVSKQMARELRCTALGGLSITPAALEIEKQLGQEPLSEASLKYKIC